MKTSKTPEKSSKINKDEYQDRNCPSSAVWSQEHVGNQNGLDLINLYVMSDKTEMQPLEMYHRNNLDKYKYPSIKHT